MATKAPSRKRGRVVESHSPHKPGRAKKQVASDFQYATGTRHRWWRDQETADLVDAMAQKWASAFSTPVVRMAIRHIEEHPPTQSQIRWIRANSKRQIDCQMTSWNGQDSELAVIRHYADLYSLSHLDVHRLAIRMLAADQGLVPAF